MSKAGEFGVRAAASIVESLRAIDQLPKGDSRIELHEKIIGSTINTMGVITSRLYTVIGRAQARSGMRKEFRRAGMTEEWIEGYQRTVKKQQAYGARLTKAAASDLINELMQEAVDTLKAAEAAYRIAEHNEAEEIENAKAH